MIKNLPWWKINKWNLRLSHLRNNSKKRSNGVNKEFLKTSMILKLTSLKTNYRPTSWKKNRKPRKQRRTLMSLSSRFRICSWQSMNWKMVTGPKRNRNFKTRCWIWQVKWRIWKRDWRRRLNGERKGFHRLISMLIRRSLRIKLPGWKQIISGKICKKLLDKHLITKYSY